MPQSLKIPPRLTPIEYLDGERLAEVRSEYIDGFVYAMARTTLDHSAIKFNLTLWLGTRLPPGCRLFNGEVKLEIASAESTAYYYPDIFISCEPGGGKEYVRREATIVVEILSPTTERVDRTEKFRAYTSLPSLHEYLLVSQDATDVEVFRRRTGWQREAFSAGSAIELDSVEQSLPVDEIYRGLVI